MSLLQEHSGEVFVLECHPHDSRILLTAGHDGVIIIWDMLAAVRLKNSKLRFAVCCHKDSVSASLCSMKKAIHASLTVSGHQMGQPLLQQIVKDTLLCMD